MHADDAFDAPCGCGELSPGPALPDVGNWGPPARMGEAPINFPDLVAEHDAQDLAAPTPPAKFSPATKDAAVWRQALINFARTDKVFRDGLWTGSIVGFLLGIAFASAIVLCK